MITPLRSRNQGFIATYYLPIALLFGVIFAAIRGIGTLGPPTYRFVLPVGFILMTLMPFIFLDKADRQRVGLTQSKSTWFYGLALLVGMTAALLCYVLGRALFETSLDNWYVTIQNA